MSAKSPGERSCRVLPLSEIIAPRPEEAYMIVSGWGGLGRVVGRGEGGRGGMVKGVGV